MCVFIGFYQYAELFESLSFFFFLFVNGLSIVDDINVTVWSSFYRSYVKESISFNVDWFKECFQSCSCFIVDDQYECVLFLIGEDNFFRDVFTNPFWLKEKFEDYSIQDLSVGLAEEDERFSESLKDYIIKMIIKFYGSLVISNNNDFSVVDNKNVATLFSFDVDWFKEYSQTCSCFIVDNYNEVDNQYECVLFLINEDNFFKDEFTDLFLLKEKFEDYSIQDLSVGLAKEEKEFFNFLKNNPNKRVRKFYGSSVIPNSSDFTKKVSIGDSKLQDFSLKHGLEKVFDFSLSLSERLLRTKRMLALPAHVNITVLTNSYDVVHS
jgi:hypothetical protein